MPEGESLDQATTSNDDAGQAKAFWSKMATRTLKAELARAQLRQADLARLLSDMGLPETKGSVSVKLWRGRFTAGFMLAALHAIKARSAESQQVLAVPIDATAEASPSQDLRMDAA